MFFALVFSFSWYRKRDLRELNDSYFDDGEDESGDEGCALSMEFEVGLQDFGEVGKLFDRGILRGRCLPRSFQMIFWLW